MKILVLGFGSIGKRHFKNIRTRVSDVEVYDPNLQSGDQQELNPTLLSLEEFQSRCKSTDLYDLTLVCSPNYLHLESFKQIYRCSKFIFIEKPVTPFLQEMEAFLELTRSLPKPIMVGCNYRFESTLIQMRELLNQGSIGRPLFFSSEFGHYLPAWRPHLDYRKNYSAVKVEGGGVLLDRIHEVDYLSWIFGPLRCVNATIEKLSNLEIDTEDYCNASFRGPNGINGTMTLDYLQPTYHCSLKVVGTEGMLEWQFKPSVLKQTLHRTGRTEVLRTGETDVNAMYVEQMNYLFDCIKHNRVPQNSLNESFHTLKLVQSIREKACQP